MDVTRKTSGRQINIMVNIRVSGAGRVISLRTKALAMRALLVKTGDC
jgi:hypothetical protein